MPRSEREDAIRALLDDHQKQKVAKPEPLERKCPNKTGSREISWDVSTTQAAIAPDVITVQPKCQKVRQLPYQGCEWL